MNSISKLIKNVCVPLGITIVAIFSTASSCGGTEGEDTRPSMEESITERGSYRLGSCILKYNLSGIVAKAEQYNIDISSELQTLLRYNHIRSDAADWVTLYDLFPTNETYDGVGARVEFKLKPKQYKPYTKIYNEYDYELVENGLVTNVPLLNSEHEGSFKAYSLKTKQNSIYIQWECSFLANNGSSNINLYYLNQSEAYSDFYVSTGVSKSDGGGGGSGPIVAAAEIIDGTIQPKDNTFSDTPSPGVYEVCITESIPLVSDLLDQGVFHAGVYKDTWKWKKPILIELHEPTIEIPVKQ